MALIITVLVVFGILVASEAWWRTQPAHQEFSRKFVHISVGSFVAFWPFFLSWNDILLLSLAFLIVVLISKYQHIFRAIHSVQRPTWGEVFFALAVGGITFVTHNKWIYLTALLQMSLADGLAAVIGIRYGRRHYYYVFGNAKSIVGTATFFLVSILIMVAYSKHADHMFITPLLVLVSAGATLIENIGVQGLDNLLVPLLVAICLRLIS